MQFIQSSEKKIQWLIFLAKSWSLVFKKVRRFVLNKKEREKKIHLFEVYSMLVKK